MNQIESIVLTSIEIKGHRNFPKIYRIGNFRQGPGIVLERVGETLAEVLHKRNIKFTHKTVY